MPRRVENSNRSSSLSGIVLRHYVRSALVPMLSIELLLVLTYFLVMSRNTVHTEDALRREVGQALPFLATHRAEDIDAQFGQVARDAAYLASRHSALESDPSAFSIEGETPRMEKAPNGTRYQSNRRQHSSLYVPLNAPWDARQQLIARQSAALDPLYEHLVKDRPNIAAAYYNTRDNLNRLYPYIDKVWEQYPPHLAMEDFNFYYLADARHDPQRVPAWTGTYLDPAGNGWMISCIAPVYRKDSLAGVVGLDLTIGSIVRNLLSQKFPWKASAFLADDSGTVLAMPAEVETILGLSGASMRVHGGSSGKEQLSATNLLRSVAPSLAAQLRAAYRNEGRLNSLHADGKEFFLVHKRISQGGLHVFLMARAEEVFRSSDEVAARSRRIGLIALAAMAIFYVGFFLYLNRQAKALSGIVSRPIARLAEATSGLGSKETPAPLEPDGIAEIDVLTKNFNALSARLDERSRELAESRIQSALRAKESELAYARGLYESASEYLHNVGNLMTRLSSSLLDLRSISDSFEQYPEAFRRIRQEEGTATLDQVQTTLLDKVVPRLKEASTEIQEVRDLIRSTITHQQSAFLESRDPIAASRFSLTDMLAKICREFRPRAEEAGLSLECELESEIFLESHPDQIYHGIVNLLKNALESCASGDRIDVSLRRKDPSRIEITVRDTGRGMDAAELAKALSIGFTTKANGHGLGLHSFAVFLSANRGRLRLESPGIGQGCSAIVEIEDA